VNKIIKKERRNYRLWCLYRKDWNIFI